MPGKYVYEVTSTEPLALARGLGNGNRVIIVTDAHGQALTVRDRIIGMGNGPQSPPAYLTLELKERLE